MAMKNLPLPLSLTLAALSGALTLKSPAGWSPAVRRAYVLVPGAATGLITAAAVLRGARQGRELAAAGRVDLVTPPDSAAAPSYVRTNKGSARKMTFTLTAFAAAVGIISSAFLALSLLVDERIETWLRRRGATRPRYVMAAIAALASLGMDQILDAREAGDDKEAKGPAEG